MILANTANESAVCFVIFYTSYLDSPDNLINFAGPIRVESTEDDCTYMSPPPLLFSFKKSAVQCCSLLPIINVKYGVSNLLYKLKYRLRPPLKKKRHRSSYIVAFGTLQVVWPRSGADVYYRQPIFQFLRSCIYLELSHDFRLKCVQCVA